jgi:hypothetical protein
MIKKKRLQTFLRLKMSDHVLLLEAVAWLGVARFLILTLPLRRINPYLGHHLLESKTTESSSGRAALGSPPSMRGRRSQGLPCLGEKASKGLSCLGEKESKACLVWGRRGELEG